MSVDPFSITLKTAVSKRALLNERVPRAKENLSDNIAPITAALHRGIHTTYDASFGKFPRHRKQLDGNADHTTKARSQHSLTAASEWTADVSGGSIREELSLPSKPEKQSLCYGLKNTPIGNLVLTRHLPNEWVTETQASSCAVLPVAQRDFYSTVRKIERKDDDERCGLVGNTQRTVDIMRKRANNPELCPAPSMFSTFSRMRPPRETDASGRPVRYCLDIVDCSQLAPQTEAQLGFDACPIARLPNARTLSQSLGVQQRIITRMGTSRPLFSGTAKVMEQALPLYAGHVPSHAHNIAMLHGNDTDPQRIWSKSYMTLAEHGGGIDARTICKNPLVRTRRGTYARQVKELPPKSDKAVCMTVEGSMLQATFKETLPAERAINRRNDKNPTIFA